MEIRVLGHVELCDDDQPVALGGAKQRAVLAMLAIDANRTVTADRLAEGLWGEHPPPSAAKMVQNYVWRVRRLLAEDGGAQIVTHGRGYELRIDPDLVDVRRLERLVSEAAADAQSGRPTNAGNEALALFRGDPLADLADEPFAAAEIRRLEELRLTAVELAIDADLAAGRHHDVAGRIDALLAENPLHERLHAQRMLALYRCGRQAEALESYRDARRTLVEEVGVEPGPELRRLHDAILRQNPALDVEPAVAELPAELDATFAPPPTSREGELRRLRVHWQRARAGTGAVVAIVGGYGMGKTRVAAEIAADAHREGAAVLYASGTEPPEAALAAVARARESQRPTLLVIDDADRAQAGVRAAVRELSGHLATIPVLALATGQDATALARLEPRETVLLEPLDAEAMRVIAASYEPAAGDPVPIDWLLAASRGVPRRIHEAASEWARREASRRVDAAADRAAEGRGEAGARHAELAVSVGDFQSARERAALLAADDERPTVCPYKGLATYDIEDAEYFFGRERLVAEVVARLVGAPLLGVVGPSGSGKSSVVRAGLLHALAGGVLPGSDRWGRVLIRPGEHPVSELRHAAGHERAVLVVDQFEELFTACGDDDERAEFVAELCRRATDANHGTVVVAVRADFYGHCAAYPDLARLLGANQVLVGPMSREELRRAIERPAQRVGLRVEPELLEALLLDVEGQPGALPLLSTALLELWRERAGRRLRLSAYVRSGGVQGAVARLAEDAFLELEPAQQAAARNVMLRLAAEGEDGLVARRRLPLGQLQGSDSAAVVARLTERRLLTTSDGAVEVAHEALLREWPRLRSWLQEDIQGRRLHHQLDDAARAWETDARDPAALYRGARLSTALEWRAGREDQLNASERAFLDASRAAAGRAHRRLQIVLAGVASLLVATVLAGLVALDERGHAQTEARVAEAQRLGAQALTEDALDRSLLLARQGFALDESAATRNTLFSALLRSPAALGVMRGTGARMLSVAVRPDSRVLVSGDGRGRLAVFDPVTRRRIAAPYSTGRPIHVVRFSPDGTRLVVASGNEQGAAVDLLDGHGFRRIAHHRLPSLDPTAFGSVVFSEDSSTFLVTYAPFAGFSPTPAGILRHWDARTGRPLGDAARVPGAGAFLIAPAAHGRATTVSGTERETVIRDSETLAPLRRFPVWGLPWASAVSANGRLAALGQHDGSVRLLDLSTGASRTLAGHHDASVQSAAFTPDGRALVTGGDDGTVIVHGVAHAGAAQTLSGHAGRVAGVAVASDGRTAYSASLDGAVIAWDLAGSRRLGRQFGAESTQPSGIQSESLRAIDNVGYRFGTDGETIAIARPGGFVNLVDARTLRYAGRFRAQSGPDPQGVGVEIAPDGATIVTSGTDGVVRFWDARTRAPLSRPLHAADGWEWSPTFSGDGRLLATAGGDSVVRLWDARRHVEIRTRRFTRLLTRDIAMRPDGRALVVPLENGQPGTGTVEVLAVPSLRTVTRIPMRWGRWSRFSRDGRLLVLGNHEGQVEIYDGRTFRRIGRPLLGHAGFILTADFSPDDRMLATSSTDGTVRLWDTATGDPIGDPLPGSPNVEVGTAFVRGGTHVAAVYDGGRGYLWDVRPSSWARRACAVAGRPLTRAEWDEALPGRPYEPACRQLPGS
jgi:WD40 repeat protein/DNA-binding SARP family transcriptional activator/ABC-type phosphonate transport system ATPase subunit